MSPPPGSADSMFSFNFDDVPSASGPGVLPGSDSDELLLNSIGDIELVQDEASQKAAAAEIRRKYDKAVSDLVDERGFTRAAALLDAFQREIEEIEDRGGKVPWRDFLGRIPIGWTPKEHEWMRKILQKEQNCSYARKSNRLDERENALKTEAGRRLSRAVWEMTKDGEAVTLTKEDVCVLRGYAAGWDDAMRQCRPRKVRKPPSTDTSMAGQYMKMRYKSSRKDKE